MNSLDGILVVGLTGQTGAGKSTVSKVFQRAGFAYIDADRVTRFVQRPGSPCTAELRDYFTDKIMTPEGAINRKVLAEIVFTNKSKLEALNSICYPYITSEILKEIRKYAILLRKVILIDAPQLFESRADDFCEIIISVVADEKTRLKRIMSRDNISKEQATNRMNNQLTEKFFIEHSDFVIKNNISLEELKAEAKEVADKIWGYYGEHYGNNK